MPCLFVDLHLSSCGVWEFSYKMCSMSIQHYKYTFSGQFIPTYPSTHQDLHWADIIGLVDHQHGSDKFIRHSSNVGLLKHCVKHLQHCITYTFVVHLTFVDVQCCYWKIISNGVIRHLHYIPTTPMFYSSYTTSICWCFLKVKEYAILFIYSIY